MRIAVMSFTRDRLAYTAHCFNSLQENAGCDYDHYVLDQGSTDNTWAWLQNWKTQKPGRWIYRVPGNIGICAGANMLLGQALTKARYDVVVRYDNDCEVTDPDTLRVCAELAHTYGAIVAPRVHGLNNPPATIRTVSLGGRLLDVTGILGGVFMAIPAFMFTEHGFRYDERNPPWTGDEAIVPWWRDRGGVCGYVHGLGVNHYETTDGQRERYPDYFDRTAREQAAA
jgi:hypothetical protein